MNRNEYNWQDKKVLIAEDSETSKQYFEAALRKTGIAITWARTGMEAVERARTLKPDLVFMDLDLPVLNGLVAARIIRQNNKAVPIIAQTAHVHTGDADASFLAGCNEFIAKPISLDLLMRTLSKYLK